jgi:hypothetical protein
LEDGREQDHWNANDDEAMKCAVIVDHLCRTQ